MKVLSIEMGNTEEIPTQSNYNGPNWDWTLTAWGTRSSPRLVVRRRLEIAPRLGSRLSLAFRSFDTAQSESCARSLR